MEAACLDEEGGSIRENIGIKGIAISSFLFSRKERKGKEVAIRNWNFSDKKDQDGKMGA